MEQYDRLVDIDKFHSLSLKTKEDWVFVVNLHIANVWIITWFRQVLGKPARYELVRVVRSQAAASSSPRTEPSIVARTGEVARARDVQRGRGVNIPRRDSPGKE